MVQVRAQKMGPGKMSFGGDVEHEKMIEITRCMELFQKAEQEHDAAKKQQKEAKDVVAKKEQELTNAKRDMKQVAAKKNKKTLKANLEQVQEELHEAKDACLKNDGVVEQLERELKSAELTGFSWRRTLSSYRLAGRFRTLNRKRTGPFVTSRSYYGFLRMNP